MFFQPLHFGLSKGMMYVMMLDLVSGRAEWFQREKSAKKLLPKAPAQKVQVKIYGIPVFKCTKTERQEEGDRERERERERGGSGRERLRKGGREREIERERWFGMCTVRTAWSSCRKTIYNWWLQHFKRLHFFIMVSTNNCDSDVLLIMTNADLFLFFKLNIEVYTFFIFKTVSFNHRCIS